MTFEYGQLLIYYPFNHGILCIYRTNEPLKSYEAISGMPYLLQQVSDEGWRIVHMEQKEPQADNDWTWRVHLQREVLE